MDKRALWSWAAGLGGVVLVVGALLGYALNDIAEEYDFIQKVPTATVAPAVGASPADAATPLPQSSVLVIAGTPGANVAVAVANIEPGPPSASEDGTPSDAAAAEPASGPLTTGDRWLRFALWVLLFGGTAGLMILIFRFLSERAEDTNAMAERLLDKGFVPEIIAVGAFAGRGEEEGVPFGQEPEVPVRVAIKGPRQAIVGVMTPYEIVDESTGRRAEGLSFTWTIDRVPPADPPDRIEPIAANGGNAANLTGSTTGELTLSVTVAGFPNIIPPVQITIVDPPKAVPAPRPQVLAYGQGWMSLVLAIVLILALLVLALEDVVDGAVVAPILGTIAGYIFGTGVQATKQGEQ